MNRQPVMLTQLSYTQENEGLLLQATIASEKIFLLKEIQNTSISIVSRYLILLVRLCSKPFQCLVRNHTCISIYLDKQQRLSWDTRKGTQVYQSSTSHFLVPYPQVITLPSWNLLILGITGVSHLLFNLSLCLCIFPFYFIPPFSLAL